MYTCTHTYIYIIYITVYHAYIYIYKYSGIHQQLISFLYCGWLPGMRRGILTCGPEERTDAYRARRALRLRFPSCGGDENPIGTVESNIAMVITLS